MTRDEIMDEVASELIARTMDPESFLREQPDNVHDVWRCILIAEAHKAGSDPVYAKLRYERGEVADVELTDRINRLARAVVYADLWKARRASISPDVA